MKHKNGKVLHGQLAKLLKLKNERSGWRTAVTF